MSETTNSIKYSFTERYTPSYTQEEVVETFNNKLEFDNWMANEVNNHARFVLRKTYLPKSPVDAPYQVVQTDYYVCDHSGIPGLKPASENGGPPKRRRMVKKESKRVGCPAKFTVNVLNNGECKVTYQWIHLNHDPTEWEEIATEGLDDETRAWLQEQVDKQMNWRSISALLRMNHDEMDAVEEEIEQRGRFPRVMSINYRAVQNLVQSRINGLSRRNALDKRSVELWLEELSGKGGCSTLWKVHPNGGPFLVSWISPRQKKILEKAEEWCIDSTHKTCKSFIDGSDCYLFSIVVVNPVTRRGVPVCFFVTNMEAIPVLKEWLLWVAANNNLSVKRVMIDCSAAETAAIKEVFGSTVDILLCHWHIKRAWETHLKRDVKVANASDATKQLRNRVRASINNLMYCTSSEEFDNKWQEFKDQYVQCSVFVAYMTSQWIPKKTLWVKAWRLDATFQTNNYVESYHQVLKGKYLGKSRNLRVDRIIYILATQMVNDYRWDAMMVNYGAARASLKVFEVENKAKADRVAENEDVARLMIGDVDDTTFCCQSFTNQGISYRVSVANGTIASCSCPYNKGICKHMFLVSAVKMLPFLHQYRPVPSASSASSVSSVSSASSASSVPSVPSVPSASLASLASSAPVSEELLESLLLDTKEKSYQLGRLVEKAMTTARVQGSRLEDLEYLVHEQRTFLAKLQKLINPNSGPSKQT
ncbi:hypothetical protein [Absidia glauca]|uniref:SWIM-type domain-containing protein n=1 Tax=Absidia glauca TaxID=4829 RepID=A0A168KTJ3_ABSGL|nr:hypothetical protein [Absidia glauca]